MRKKKELIKKFIEENCQRLVSLMMLKRPSAISGASERSESLKNIASAENIPIEKFEHLIGEYLYTQKTPMGRK